MKAVCECGRKFKNGHALSMHKFRAHGIRKGDDPKTTPSEPVTEEPAACFCPRCGLNLRVVNKAMNLAGRMK
jgi:hypothetical protein